MTLNLSESMYDIMLLLIIFSCIHRHFKIISNTCSKMCIKDEWNLFSIASDFKWLCKEGSSKVVLITVKPFGWAGEGRIVKPLKCLTDCFSVCYFKQAMSTLLKVKVKGKVDFIVIMLMTKELQDHMIVLPMYSSGKIISQHKSKLFLGGNIHLTNIFR